MSKKRKPIGLCMTPSKTPLGNFIRTRRLRLGWNQSRLAEQVGNTQIFISQIEIGIRKYLNDQQLEWLTKVLGCNPEELHKRMPVRHIAQPKTERGRFIRARREELGFTLEDLAKEMGITAIQARNLERSMDTRFGYNSTRLLSKALKLNPKELERFLECTGKKTESALGQLIRARRRELQMGAGDLAEKLGVTRAYISQIELGICRLSSNDVMVQRIAEALEMKVGALEVVRLSRRIKQVKGGSPLGEFLVARRFELSLTLAEVATRAKVTAGTVRRAEHGYRNPNFAVLRKIAKALRCKIPDDLMGAEN